MTGGDAMAGIVAGLRASVSAEVTEDDTARALGSGDVPVLATPRLLALAEAACVAAMAGRLDDDRTTVGTGVSLEHRRATPVGERVDVAAELVEVAGRRLRFNFIAYGPGEGEQAVIGAGTAERVVVSREKFLATADRVRH